MYNGKVTKKPPCSHLSSNSRMTIDLYNWNADISRFVIKPEKL
jgi:hypothetical protein